jgi:hypothetical protein
LNTFSSTSTEALVGAGIAAAKSGDKAQAYTLLTQALASDLRHEHGWLWLSGVVGSDAERHYCLEQVLTLNPHSAAAQHGLALLPRGVLPISPLPAPAPEPQPAAGPAFENGQVDAFAPLAAAAIPAPAGQAAPELLQLPAAGPVPATQASQPDIDFAVQQLGAGRTADEVSRALCEQRGYAWDNARQLVLSVQGQHRTKIARRQAPFLIFLGVVTLIGGILLLGYAVLRVRFIGYVYSPLTYRNIAFAFITGTLMTLGSIVGTAQVIRSMW